MATSTNHDPVLRIPVLQQELTLGRREVETGAGIRLHKHVSEDTCRIDDSVLRQQLDIEHVPVNAWVDGALPAQRHEGPTLVIPVLEEVLVVQKRIRLVEEIRITARTRSEPVTDTVVLRREQVEVERFDAAGTAPTAERPIG